MSSASKVRTVDVGLERVAKALRERGLAPIIDAELELVRAECPSCRAGARDPLGLYRPLAVISRGDVTRFFCDACGRRTETRDV
jgi:hypothetical protein